MDWVWSRQRRTPGADGGACGPRAARLRRGNTGGRRGRESGRGGSLRWLLAGAVVGTALGLLLLWTMLY